MIAQRSILEIIDEHLNSSAFKLPTYSPLAARIQAIARNPDADMRHIEQAILHDPVLAAQVLKVANSALYSGLAKASTIGQAIARLGVSEIVTLVVLCTQAGQYRARNATIDQWMVLLWRHARGCALGARWLAERSGDRARAPEAFLGGLFHDIGKLALLMAFDELEGMPQTQGRFSSALMREVLIAKHAEQGARLLSHWNLADTYIDIARHHHAEHLDPHNPLLAMVRLADRSASKVGLNLAASEPPSVEGNPEAALLGLDDEAVAELERLLQDAMLNLSKAA